MRAIAVDLDGTLLNNQRILSKRNENALMEAASRGWIIMTCR
jgi:hydroxymethylpyrimidine pyrophosphatase-like HAD family hydrolase